MDQQELIRRVRALDINDCFEVARVNVTSYLESDKRSPRPEQTNYDIDRHLSCNVGRWRRALQEASDPDGGDKFLGVDHDSDQGLSGYIQFGKNRKTPTDAEIHSLYVDPLSWGNGVGRALFSKAVQNLKEEGYNRLTVKTLRDDPIPNNFYRKMGFDLTAIFKRIEGTRIVEYEMDLGKQGVALEL